MSFFQRTQGVHPEIVTRSSTEAPGRALSADDAAKLSDLTARIRSYRPAATVFEAEVAPIRSFAAGGIPAFTSSKAFAALDVMKNKRAMHSQAIAQQEAARVVAAGGPSSAVVSAKQWRGGNRDDADNDDGGDGDDDSGGGGRAGGGAGVSAAAHAFVATGKYRDERFFLDPLPRQSHFVERGLSNREQRGGAAALQDNVLDLIADDAQGQGQQRAVTRWDARKRRYVQMHGGDAEAARKGVKKVKTESGATVRKDKLTEAGKGLFKKWQQKTHVRVVRVSLGHRSIRKQRGGTTSASFRASPIAATRMPCPEGVSTWVLLPVENVIA